MRVVSPQLAIFRSWRNEPRQQSSRFSLVPVSWSSWFGIIASQKAFLISNLPARGTKLSCRAVQHAPPATDTFMHKHKLSCFRLLAILAAGIIAWLTTNWLLEPKPFTILMPNYYPPKGYLDSHPRQNGIKDAQEFWLADTYAEPLPGGRVAWIVSNLKTGETREEGWPADSHSPFQMTSGVPIVGGYRYFSITPDNRYDVVDTHFPDGNSTLRLHLSADALMPRCLSPFLFGRNGSRLISFHPFPQSYLRLLGNINGVPWDAFAVQHLRTLLELKYEYIALDSLLVQVWDVEAAKVVHSTMWPPLTNLHNLGRSPGGRWLVRSETGLLPERWFVPTNPSASETGINLRAASPRGLFVLDCDTGESLHLIVATKDDREGAFGLQVDDAGLSFCPITLESHPGGTVMIFPGANRRDYFYRLPGGKSIPLRTNPLIRTMDGTNVTYWPLSPNCTTVKKATVINDEADAESRPLEIGHQLYHVLPTCQPALLYVDWHDHFWPNSLIDLCKRIGLDLNRHFPRGSVGCALIDVKEGKIIWEHQTNHHAPSPTVYNLTYDGSAILLKQVRDRDLHITRWDLPLSLWSPWWGRAAGLIVLALFWVLATKLSSKQTPPVLQRSQ
jgi:hypothetical protein